MAIALILAGGIGTRMGEKIPKQFIQVDGKPVVAYTLENFQRHAQIDAIVAVCLDGWQDELKTIARQYGISKLKWVVAGGADVQESIRNGVFFLEGKAHDEDIVVVHDGIRPLVDEGVLTDVIDKAVQYGNAVTSLPYNEQIFIADDSVSTTRFIPRDTVRRVATPQAYRFDLLLSKYREAYEKGIGIQKSHYTNTMMVSLGVRLYFAAGSDRNIKLTTRDDLELFKAYVRIARQAAEQEKR